MNTLGACLLAVCLPAAWAQNPAAPPPAAHPPAAGPTLERIARQADAARQAGNSDQAIALFKKGVALKPSWEEGWWGLGSLYYDLDNYPQGRDAFRRLAGLNPKVGITWAMLGLCEFQTRQYDQASAHLARGIAMGTGADQSVVDVAKYHLALLLTRAEEYEQSLKLLAEFAQRNLNHPNYVEAMGLAALRKPLLPSELPPAEREIVMDVGRAMYDATARHSKESESDFRLLLDKYPTTPNIHYLYGTSLLNSDAERALAEMKKELEISPAHVPALVAIAAELLRGENYKDALPYAEKAAGIDTNSFPAHAILGRILVEGDLDKPRGVKELELARQLQPGSPQVRIALASAYAKVGRASDAARERQEFQKLKKESDERNSGQP